MPETPASRDIETLHKQVEERAYALWESQGRPHGRDLDHWRQAESDLMAANSAELAPKPPGPAAASAANKKAAAAKR
jgi:hypothetical protein